MPNTLRSLPPIGCVGCHSGRSVSVAATATGSFFSPESAVFAVGSLVEGVGRGGEYVVGPVDGAGDHGTGLISEYGHGPEKRSTATSSGIASRNTKIAVHCACLSTLMPRNGVTGSEPRAKKTMNWLTA